MSICGIEIKGSEAIFAMATLQDGTAQHLANACKKIALDDDDEAANVKAFATQVAAFVRDNGISRIAIKKRSKKANSPAARPPSRSKACSSCWTTAK